MSGAKRFMDPLAGGSDESSSSGSDSDDAQEAKRPKPAAKSQPEVDPESLVCGTSVLFVPEPKQDGQQAWDWGDGAAHKDAGGDAVDRESREATREAVGSGLNQSVETAFMAAQRTAEMREAKRREAHELAEERRMSYQQREKRKRDKGQAKGGGKNFVEEEKRLARNHGVYSGFDT